MKRVVFDEEKARRLRNEGMSYENIAKRIEGASEITIYRRLNPQKENLHRETTRRRQRIAKARLIESKGGKCSIL